MSAAAPPGVAAAGAGSATGNLFEGCPLCGAPLRAEQEWCLNCGAAARTRLAAAPNWRAPLVTLGVLVVLALGVLAGALVKLAGDSGPAPAALTTTVTSPAAAVPTPGASTSLGATTTATIPPPTTTAQTPTSPTATAPSAGTPQTTTTTRAGGALSGLGGGTQAGR